jgi:YkoY family integral membrane protein
MYGQTFETHDIAIVGLLIVLEGVLSIDNALVLGILAKRLPKHLQGKALTYGLVGAFVFRLIAIGAATFLLRWNIVKLVGGGYLVYIAIKHFFFSPDHEPEHLTVGPDGQPHLADPKTGQPLPPEEENKQLAAHAPPMATLAAPARGGTAKFWPTVFVIELTDIAFAVDSIVAAIGVVGPPPQGAARHPKLWVVVAGGMLGVILMRFAAVLFIRLLERFPRFEVSAYLLVIVIGLKLIADWMFNTVEHHALDFHSPKRPEFWVFWLLMIGCFAVGFIPKRAKSETPQPVMK